MSNSEEQFKPITGDDGELLEADSQVDVERYEDYVWGYEEPRTRIAEIRALIGNNIVFIVACILIFSFSSPSPKRRFRVMFI